MRTRSLRRVVRGERLWNGNRERWRHLLDPRPEKNVVTWSWVSHGPLRRRYRATMTDPRWAHLSFVRLRSRAEAAAWLEDATRA